MAKDPVFPLYYNDIDRSTKTWTDEEFGAYMRLLMEQWDKGSLPNDYQRLTRIATSLDRNWSLLKDKFPAVDGVLKNPVLEAHREKRAKHKEKQRENVNKRYQKSTKTLPLEIEKEKENELLLNNNGEFEIFDDWIGWGKLIVDDLDQHWHAMRGRKVTQEEMDSFLSVATRNKWKMQTQGEFRISLNGFKTNGDSTGNIQKNSTGGKTFSGKYSKTL